MHLAYKQDEKVVEQNMVKAKFVKIVTETDSNAWWNVDNLVGEILPVIYQSNYDYVKVKYNSESIGWLPLRICEINPHIKLVK